MAFTFQDRYAPFYDVVPFSPGRLLAAVLEARQRRADERLKSYLCGLPDDVIRKLGLSPGDMAKLRRTGSKAPPGLYGRVSVVSVLRSARY